MPTETTTHGRAEWTAAWERALPTLALVGPGSWLIAALIRAAGVGTLEGDLWWISRHEGFVLVLGIPFFVATFIFLGRFIATRTVRAGIAITAMGIVGVAPLAVVSGIRLFMGVFTDYGIDPAVLQRAFDAMSPWYLGFFLMNAAQFLAWIVAGIVILRTGVAPR